MNAGWLLTPIESTVGNSMGPTIILDKSTLQMLSLKEIVILQKYYYLNLIPVLPLEILGDLKKEEKGLQREQRVQDLTKKIFALPYFENIYYKQIIAGNLLGHKIPMDGRTLICESKRVQTSDGQIGNYDDGNSPEMKALLRWRTGDFKSIDHELHDRWKRSIASINLEGRRANLSQYPTHKHLMDQGSVKSDGLKGIKVKIDDLLNQHEMCDQLLLEMRWRYDLDKRLIIDAFHRKRCEEHRSIKTLAPYAYHCLSMDYLFKMALILGIVGPRPTNQIDLEYLYYLPFTNVFSSNDKFLRKLGSVVCENQDFISGDDLKSDLFSIVASRDELDENNQKRWQFTFQHYPPYNERSFTSQMWLKHCHYSKMRCPSDLKDPPKVDPERKKIIEKAIVDVMKKKAAQCDMNPETREKGGDDFYIRRVQMLEDDPCPCGSGKKFFECHGLKEFNKQE